MGRAADAGLGEVADLPGTEDHLRLAFLADYRIAFAFPRDGTGMLRGQTSRLLDGGFLACGDPRFESPDRLISVIEVEGKNVEGGERSDDRGSPLPSETRSDLLGFGDG